MRTIASIAGLREALHAQRAAGRSVAFVPTMGALHEGHLSLVERGRREADIVVMSVFVNPLQFGPGEDLARYPRDPAGDADAARRAGVELLFAPDAGELYPHPPRVTLGAVGLGDRWEGEVRPGHFAGVLTVVLKLLNVVQPDVVVFGHKDFQQAAVVRAMIEDLDLPVRMVVAPTVREPDGVALSSRNRYLSADDRRQAPRLNRALRRAAGAFANGETSSAAILTAARAELEASPALAVDYLSVVDARTLEPVAVAHRGDAILLAARLGGTRLIDNIVLEPA
ncbi:MAG: pantoate--beta-alanine ligase [Gemmatimonadaceae bacterium]